MAIAGIGITALDFFNSLTVTPEVLRAKAQSVQGRINELQKAFDAMKTQVNKTQNYWIGEAGDAHRESYRNKEADIAENIKRLREEVSDLNEMASVYASTEQTVAAIAEDLPFDVIV